MISDEERRLLGRISRHVFGRINAWTTLNDDAETERLVRSLISQGLVEAYGEKMTCAGTPSGSGTDDRAVGHMGGTRRRSR